MTPRCVGCRRKLLSRRRVKARFMVGRRVAMYDVVRHRLEFFVEGRYELSDASMHIKRRFPPITITLDEFSMENLRDAFLGN